MALYSPCITNSEASGAQVIPGSTIFDASNSMYLQRTPSVAGNRRTWTLSFWHKRANLAGTRGIFSTYTDSSARDSIYWGSGNSFHLNLRTDSSWHTDMATNPRFRGTGWSHYHVVYDSPHPTSTSRVRMWVNGIEMTWGGGYAVTYPGQNIETGFNKAAIHRIGCQTNHLGTRQEYVDGYLSNYYFLDSAAFGPEYFGFTDPLTGTWRPKAFKEITGFKNPNNAITWSSGWATPTGGWHGSGAAVNSFDGSSSSYTSAVSTGVEFTWTAPSALSGKLRIYCDATNSGIGAAIKVNGSQVSTCIATQWYDLGTFDTISSIAFAPAVGNRAWVYQIEVDGYIVMDAAKDNSFYLPFDGTTRVGYDASGNGNHWTPSLSRSTNAFPGRGTGAKPILNIVGSGNWATSGVSTDTSSSGLVLAIPCNGEAKDYSHIINASTTEKVPSSAGAFLQYATSAWYGMSLRFTTNTPLKFPSSTDYDFDSGDFTIEGWFLTSSATYDYSMVSRWDTSANQYWNFWLDNGIAKFDWKSSGTTYSVSGNWQLTHEADGKWNHMAVVRNGDVFSIYVNGQRVGTTTQAGSVDGGGTQELWIGGDKSNGSGTNWWDGHLNDIRVYKGVAKYTAEFLPEVAGCHNRENQSPHQAQSDSPSGTPNVACAPTTSGSVSLIGGSSDEYVSTQNSADYTIYNGDFTVEGWWFSSAPSTGASPASAHLFTTRIDANDRCSLYLDSGTLKWWADGSTRITGPTFIPNKWYHVAVTKSSGVTYLYVDGQQEGSVTYTYDQDTANQTLQIGAYNAGANDPDNWKGFVSNFRLTKGQVLYTGNFTPPTKPLTLTSQGATASNVKLLCCQSPTQAGAAGTSPNMGGINDGTVWSAGSGDLVGGDIQQIYDGDDSTSVAEFGTGWSSLGFEGVSVNVGTSFKLKTNTGSAATVEWLKDGNGNIRQFQGSAAVDYRVLYDADSQSGTNFTGIITGPLYVRKAAGSSYMYGIKVDDALLKDPVNAYNNAIANNFNPFDTNSATTTPQGSGNWCTWSLAVKSSAGYGTLKDGDLRWYGANSWRSTTGTLGPITSGKWYYEGSVKGNTYGTATGNLAWAYGWCKSIEPLTDEDFYNQTTQAYRSLVIHNTGGYNNFNTYVASVCAPAEGDIIGCALDKDSNTFKFFLNGQEVISGDLFDSGASLVPYALAYYNSSYCNTNFGQRPFAFPPPAGYNPVVQNARPTQFGEPRHNEGVRLQLGYGGNTWSQSYLRVTTPSGNGCSRANTEIPSTGKWYAECKWVSGSSMSVAGIVQRSHSESSNLGQGSYGYGYASSGSFQHNGADAGSPASYANGDIIGIYVDSDAGSVEFFKNGVSQGTNWSSGLTSYPYYFAVSDGSSGGTGEFLWWFDGFQYTPPPGAKSLNTPVATRPIIVRPTAQCGFTTYMGNGGKQFIELGFQPDIVWTKARNASSGGGWNWTDSINGGDKYLMTNNSNTLGTYSADKGVSFDKTGVTLSDVAGGDENLNGSSGGTYAGTWGYLMYAWKAGGNKGAFNKDDVEYPSAAAAGLATQSNVAISHCSINTKSQFSMLKYYRTSDVNAEVSHGLEGKPDFIIWKCTEDAYNWDIWHSSLSMLKTLTMTSDNVRSGAIHQMPNETTIPVTDSYTGGSTSNQDTMAYIWKFTPGYSAGGLYVGTSNDDGPVIDCGFEPGWILFKKIDSSSAWSAFNPECNGSPGDDSQPMMNPQNMMIHTTLTTAQAPDAWAQLDILPNGFKIRGQWAPINTSDSSGVIWVAFAKNPTTTLFGGQSLSM